MRLGWILLVVLALGPAAAVAEDPRNALQDDQIEQWNIFNADNSDLPNDDVAAVLVADGVLWAGMWSGGLARFEDGQWQVYNAANSDLPDNDVLALAAVDGALWVATWGGGLARLEGGQWRVYTKANSKLPSNHTQALATADGALWVGTRDGLARLDTAGQWLVYRKADSGLPDDNVRALAVADDALWVGTGAGGLARLDDDGHWQVYTEADGGLPDDDVRALAVADGALWVGTGAGGLARLEDGSQWQVHSKADSGLPDDDVRALAVAGGALWVGTGGGGLARLADGHWQVYSVADGGGLPDNDAVALAAVDGALWVGMGGGGLARLGDGQWRVYATANRDQPIDYVEALAAADDVLWAGTWGGGLVRFADGKWQIHTTANSNLPDDSVQALTAADGVVWIGTSSGLARFDNDKWQIYTKANDDLPDDDVRALAVADGAVWVGTAAGGLVSLAEGKRQVYTPANSSLPSDIIQALAVADDALWVGTRGGLARFAKGQWRVYTKANSGLPADNVLALAVADDGLWVGTGVGGLAHLAGDEWQVYTPADSGLPDYEVLALAATDGALWVGTGGGGLARLADKQWQVYTPANSSLPDDDVPLLAAADGALWVGTRGSGLARFEPAMAQPEIVTLVGAGDGADENSIGQAQHVIAARAFDPSYLTHESLFRFDWTLQRTGVLDILDRVVSRAAYYTARFKEDGRYTLTVVAIDRYGKRSEPRHIKFVVSLPKASPWRDRVIDIGMATGGALLLYFLAVFPLIVLYPRAGWARTMLNSGFFSRFPILHRLILNAGWARRRLFGSCASRDSERAAVPNPYIPQFVYRRGQPEPLSVGDDVTSLPSLLGSTNRVLLMARSGTGKSVLLHRILQVCARAFLNGKYRYLPILIDLRTSPVGSRTVEQLVHDALKGGQVELPDDQLDFLIAKGGFLLLIDSVNETPSEMVAASFHPFLNRDTDNAVIMASQVDVLERADMPAFNLAEVTPQLAREHLTKAVGHDIWDVLSLDAQALTRNPQDLTLLIEVVKALGPAKVPTHRAELYRAILRQDSALADWIETGDPGLNIIYALAFHMFGEERVLTTDRLREWLFKHMQMQGGGADQKERLNDLMDRISRSNLFREETAINVLGQATPVFGFRHELIGKFLASRHLRPAIEQRKQEALDEWVELSRDVRWTDVFCFAIDELSDNRALNAMLEWLLVDANDVQVRIVAYAIGTREDGILPRVRQDYAAAKLDEDLQRTPAIRVPKVAA